MVHRLQYLRCSGNHASVTRRQKDTTYISSWRPILSQWHSLTRQNDIRRQNTHVVISKCRLVSIKYTVIMTHPTNDTVRHITHLSALYAHSRLQNDIRRHNDALYQKQIVVIMAYGQCKVHSHDDTSSRTSYITLNTHDFSMTYVDIMTNSIRTASSCRISGVIITHSVSMTLVVKMRMSL